MLVRDLASRLGLPFEGEGELEITAAAPLETAGPGEIAFAAAPKAFSAAQSSGADCLIVPPGFEPAQPRTLIRAEQPRTAFAGAVELLYPLEPAVAGRHAAACIDDTARVDPSASIGPHVTIESHVTIGARCLIGAGSFIGAGTEIGPDTTLFANVAIYPDVAVGARCILHAGCVLGADGFGFVLTGGRYRKFPQIGRVVLEDDVEIGANSCVDRAALGVTRIGQGAKLDNMVHIGHNCDIGRHVVIAAQTGLSGGVVVEDYAVIGGQVGIGDKARIQSHAVLGSGCGILTSKIVRSGEVVWGTPARPLREHLQQLASLSKLPALRAEVAELRRRLDELESRR